MNRIIIPGKPKGKGRPRFARGITYTPRDTTEYERKVARAYTKAGHKLIEGECRVTIEAVFLIPKSWPKYRKEETVKKGICPTGKPDVDNIVKIILDGLNGVAYWDDAQVVDVEARKIYSTKEEKVIIEVEEVTHDKRGTETVTKTQTGKGRSGKTDKG